MRISVWKKAQVSHCEYAAFVIIVSLFSCLFRIITCFGHFPNIGELFALDYHHQIDSRLELDHSSIYLTIASNIFTVCGFDWAFLNIWTKHIAVYHQGTDKWVIEIGIFNWGTFMKWSVYTSIGSCLVIINYQFFLLGCYQNLLVVDLSITNSDLKSRINTIFNEDT